MANYNVMDDAERIFVKPRATEDLTGFGTGSSSSDALAAVLFVVSAYALLAEQNMGLFTLAFLAFAFFYNPVRIRIGQTITQNTSSVI